MSWELDDLQATIDPQEDENGVTQVRDHITVQLHQKVEIATIFSTPATGQAQAVINYTVAGSPRSINPVGAGKFICVGDGLAPLEAPSTIVVRRQTWEYFSAWRAAPPEWNQ